MSDKTQEQELIEAFESRKAEKLRRSGYSSSSPFPQTEAMTSTETDKDQFEETVKELDTSGHRIGDTEGAASYGMPPAECPEPPELPNGVDWWIDGLAKDAEPEASADRTLLDFVSAAVQRNYEAFERIRLDDEITSGDRDFYRSPTRILVGLLKSRQEFEGLDEDDALHLMERTLWEIFPGVENPWYGTWNRGSEDEYYIPTTDTFDHEIEPRDDFLYNWARWRPSKKPMLLEGVGLQRAEELAQKYPVRSLRHRSPLDVPYLQVVSLCYWLARLRKKVDGEETFFLGVRDAGRFAGCSHPTAGKHLSRARRDQLVELVNGEDRRRREAQEFRFDLERIGFARG